MIRTDINQKKTSSIKTGTKRLIMKNELIRFIAGWLHMMLGYANTPGGGGLKVCRARTAGNKPEAFRRRTGR
ncbi:MAG: hypothetical protein A2V90_05495 [Gammaproteobacteria bacterium RBG_16_57_12]|nr:MAG: hypothetical protein A2V90_05495 [Gammaproteobacteria bacterium RBG_16_57_12]